MFHKSLIKMESSITLIWLIMIWIITIIKEIMYSKEVNIMKVSNQNEN